MKYKITVECVGDAEAQRCKYEELLEFLLNLWNSGGVENEKSSDLSSSIH